MINVLIEKGKSFIEKGRKVKSRGIALTHKDQGYSANNREISLLMKSDIDPNTLTVEMIKSLEQVQLKVSMEEFLRRFFDMWSSDAELLTKVLGLKTEFEARAEEDQDDDDIWQTHWNQQHREYIEEKVAGIQLLKSVQEGKELTLPEQYSVFQIRKAFEEGTQDQGLTFVEPSKPETSKVPDPVVPETPDIPEPTAPEVPVVPVAPQPQAPSVEQDLKKTKENTVDPEKTVPFDITKSKEYQEMVAAMEILKSKAESADEIIKAHTEARKEVLVNKASAMTFVTEDQREPVVEMLMKSADSKLVLDLLEKAQAALVAKDAEINEVKKSFANGKAVGTDGELNKAATGELTAQQKLDEIIKAKEAALKASA